MAHGSGGTMMRDIIEQLFFEAYAGETLKAGDDAGKTRKRDVRDGGTERFARGGDERSRRE